MTLLKKFDDTGKEIGSENVSIDETNLLQAKEQYGNEWSNGYVSALADVMKAMTEMMTRNDKYLGEVGSSPQVVGRKAIKFHEEKSVTLEKLTKLLSESKLNL